MPWLLVLLGAGAVTIYALTRKHTAASPVRRTVPTTPHPVSHPTAAASGGGGTVTVGPVSFSPPAASVDTSGLTNPGSLPAYPGTGAWQSNATWIMQYQAALSYLSQALGQPSWSPGSISGVADAPTMAAVRAFQSAHGLTVDGKCGVATAFAINSELASA